MNFLNKITNKFSNKSFNDVLSMVGSQILINPLQMVKSFIVLKYINPEIYGILKSAELIKMLNKLAGQPQIFWIPAVYSSAIHFPRLTFPSGL